MTSINAVAAPDPVVRALPRSQEAAAPAASAPLQASQADPASALAVQQVPPAAPAHDPSAQSVQTVYDTAAHHTVYRVTDRRSGDVVEAVPSTSLLKFYVAFHAEIEDKTRAR